MKTPLKKALPLLTALLLLLFSGCRRQPLPTAAVLTPDWQEIELPLITIVADESMWQLDNLKAVLKTVPGYDTEFTAQIVKLDAEPQRSIYLDSMRVELMAGKGPDLFLCDCLYGNIFGQTAKEGDGPMFPFPQQLMENRIFLPLDQYLDSAQYTEPEKILPCLMELGRGSEGQMIIPLQYDFMLTAVPAEKYTEPPEKSRQGLINSGNAYLEHAGRGGSYGASLLDSFGSPADYAREELTFTEAELLETALDFWEGNRLWSQGYFAQNAPGVTHSWASDQLQEDSGADIRFVPTYNRDGGITAFVTNYAAINRNASYPAYAFRVVDTLAGKAQQKSRTLYGWSVGLPTHSDLGGSEPLGLFTLSGDRQSQYLELRDSITAAKFLTALDREAWFGIGELCCQEDCTREDVEKAVKNSYRTMEMMLAES